MLYLESETIYLPYPFYILHMEQLSRLLPSLILFFQKKLVFKFDGDDQKREGWLN